MGTAGFGAALAQSLPILLGGFSPDGLGSDEGLMASDFFTDAVVLVTDAASDDADDAGAGASVSSRFDSCVSLIFNHFLTSKLLTHFAANGYISVPTAYYE